MSNKELAIFTIELRAFFLASGTLISIIHHKNCINKMISISGGLNAYLCIMPYLLFFVKASRITVRIYSNNMYINKVNLHLCLTMMYAITMMAIIVASIIATDRTTRGRLPAPPTVNTMS